MDLIEELITRETGKDSVAWYHRPKPHLTKGEVEGGGLQVQSQPDLQKEFSASTGNLVRPGAKLKDKKRDGDTAQ